MIDNKTRMPSDDAAADLSHVRRNNPGRLRNVP